MKLWGFHSNEFPWNFPGISLGIHRNSIQTPLGIHRNHSGNSMEIPWNSTGNPWESTGMAHSYHSCGFRVEFQHSMGIHRNPAELMEEGKVLLLLRFPIPCARPPYHFLVLHHLRRQLLRLMPSIRAHKLMSWQGRRGRSHQLVWMRLLVQDVKILLF